MATDYEYIKWFLLHALANQNKRRIVWISDDAQELWTVKGAGHCFGKIDPLNWPWVIDIMNIFCFGHILHTRQSQTLSTSYGIVQHSNWKEYLVKAKKFSTHPMQEIHHRRRCHHIYVPQDACEQLQCQLSRILWSRIRPPCWRSCMKSSRWIHQPSSWQNRLVWHTLCQAYLTGFISSANKVVILITSYGYLAIPLVTVMTEDMCVLYTQPYQL